MKYLISILLVSLCSACATRKQADPKRTPAVSGTTVPQKRMAAVRTPEVVKSYSVGRYADPNNPETMHERHTVYRREQGPDWNFLPDPPVSLPPSANSNPSPSYHGGDPRQRIYAEALQEQNRAMKQRLDSLQQDASRVPALELEIDQLKKQIRQTPPPTEPANPPTSETGEENDVFSAVNPDLPVADEFTDLDAITLFPASDAQNQDLLLSQMRLNDQFAAELEKAEQRQRASLVTSPFLRRRELAFLNPKTP
jgi:hypothetical protein